MLFRQTSLFQITLLLLILLGMSSLSLAATEREVRKAVTTSDPDIDVSELRIMLVPMTSEELFIEADSWMALLQTAAERVASEKLIIKKENDQIATEKQDDSDQAVTSKNEAKVEALQDKKEETLSHIDTLRSERTLVIERLDTVLLAINGKIGLDAKGKELAEVLPYRRYIDTVSGLKLEVNDTKSALLGIKGFLVSEDGGQKWLKNIIIFIATLVFFWFLSALFSKAVTKALNYSSSNSVILNSFIINSIRRIIFFIGILIALSVIGISVAPLLAVIGAAGFIIAFALQSTLSNFASGLMIMFYRPFDVHDLVEVAGITGKVKSMTLVSTTIMTPDNKLMLVPNNSIWGDVIINAYYSAERRVDMIFGIGYDDDIECAIQVMTKVLAEHSLVLDQPEATVQVSELADSSVNFICRPWVKTADYWTVYWDVTRAVKEAFDAAGISIPFPQSDVHLYQQTQSDDEHDVATKLVTSEKTNVSKQKENTGVDLDDGEAEN